MGICGSKGSSVETQNRPSGSKTTSSRTQTSNETKNSVQSGKSADPDTASSPEESLIHYHSINPESSKFKSKKKLQTVSENNPSINNSNNMSKTAVNSTNTNNNINNTSTTTITTNTTTTTTTDNNNDNKLTNKRLSQAKFLLLGSGESGKSTILKQIKIIHQNGFSEREKIDYKPFVFQNICESAQCIVKALKQYDLVSKLINVSSDDLNFILNYEVPLDTENNDPLDPNIANLIEKLVSDPTVQELLKNHEYEFYILDSAIYFFENLKRIKDPNYLPNVTDILRTRKQTSGIFDTKFQMEDLDVHLFDVGGQRSERKKWIHCFDNVTAIIFCVSLSEYDQMLLESPTKNRLEESLNLFESVVNSMWFRRTAVILCLNKIDIFIEKLPNSPMEKYFPDYVGGANVNKAVKYILWRFKQLNRANLNLVPYVTQATDTNNIKLAFAIVRETILHNNLLDSGIISA